MPRAKSKRSKGSGIRLTQGDTKKISKPMKMSDVGKALGGKVRSKKKGSRG